MIEFTADAQDCNRTGSSLDMEPENDYKQGAHGINLNKTFTT